MLDGGESKVEQPGRADGSVSSLPLRDGVRVDAERSGELGL